MKYILAVVALVALSSCATPVPIGPKPQIAPVRVSNEKTRASLKETRTYIKESQASSAAGQDSLKSALEDIDLLLRE